MDEWDRAEGDDILEQDHDGPGLVSGLVGGHGLVSGLVRGHSLVSGLVGGLAGWFPRLAWRPSRGAAMLGGAGLVLGLAAGYAAGDRGVEAGSRRPPGAALVPRAAPALRFTPAVSDSLPPSASPPDCGPGAPRPLPARSPFPTGQHGRELIRSCTSTGSGYVSSASAAVSQTTGACSVQAGHELQLGVEVSNQTTSDVSLQRVMTNLPLSGGLREVSWDWGTCGAISSRAGPFAEDRSRGEDLSPGERDWFTVTVRVLVKCPAPYPVQFVVQYESAGRTSFAQVQGFSDLGQVPYSGCAGH